MDPEDGKYVLAEPIDVHDDFFIRLTMKLEQAKHKCVCNSDLVYPHGAHSLPAANPAKKTKISEDEEEAPKNMPSPGVSPTSGEEE